MSLISLSAKPYHARPGVAFVPFHDAPPLDYGLLWPSEHVTDRIRAFTRAVRETASV